MASIRTDSQNYAAIAQSIRDKTGQTTKYLPSEMAAAIQRIEGGSMDAFWDVYQQSGNRGSYEGAFYGSGWTADTFKPKYPVAPNGSATRIFASNPIVGDLRDYCVLDLSGATNVSYAFYYSKFTHLGVLDLSGVTAAGSYAQTFAGMSNLVEIEQITFGATSGSYSSVFNGASNLVKLTVAGEIKAGGLSFYPCTKLSRASIESVVAALSTETSGLTITFSKASVNAAFSDAEWATLTASRGNWDIKTT